MSVTDISTGIKARVVSLQATSKELEYGLDVSKNKFRATYTGYAVVPEDIRQTTGALSTFTVDQLFTVKLARSFGPDKTGDQAQLVAANTLYQEMYDLCKSLVTTKPHAGVLLVSEVEVGKVQLSATMVTLTATLKIKYRQAL